MKEVCGCSVEQTFHSVKRIMVGLKHAKQVAFGSLMEERRKPFLHPPLHVFLRAAVDHRIQQIAALRSHLFDRRMLHHSVYLHIFLIAV